MEKQLGMNMYEIGYLVMPLVPEDAALSEHSAIKAGLEKIGAVIGRDEAPRLRPIAYSIPRRISDKKFNFTDAYFGWVRYEVDPSLTAAVRDLLDRRENLLRHLIISIDKKEIAAAEAALAAQANAAAVAPEADASDVQAEAPTEALIDKQIDEMIAPMI